MGIGSRPATCVSCGKRLNRKQWYYRNGKFFCKKRCWVTEARKSEKDTGSAQAVEPKEKSAKAASASA